MQRLFSVPKVGFFVDSYGPATEKRREETCTVIKMALRLQPFDAKLAASIDDGLSDNSGVRAALFKLNNPEPKPHIERLDFGLSCPRQNLEVFAAPDTDESRIVFLQVKIGKVYARTQRDMDGFALVVNASFGPVDRATLEFVHAHYGKQIFISFTESEPSLEFSEEVNEDDVDDPPFGNRPAPMFDDADDEPESAGVKAAEEASTDRRREKGHNYARRGRAIPKAESARKGSGKAKKAKKR